MWNPARIDLTLEIICYCDNDMGKPKIGLCLPTFAGASAWDLALNFETMKSTIRTSEQLGFDSLWVPDHLTMGHDSQIFEAWTVLAAASQLSERIRLGTLVTCASHRPPALLAKMAATLDVISNGRLELGLGAGWRRSEQISYDLPWETSFKRRLRRLIETVEIVEGMWSNRNFSYTGQYYKVDSAVCEPKPIQKPCPRIWLGGSGEKWLLNVVAKYADGWNVGEIRPEEYARKLNVLRAHCNSHGTDYDHIEKSLETIVLISERPEDLERIVRWSNWFAAVQAETKEMKPATGNLENMKQQYILGSLRDVTERAGEYVKAGVQHFMIYFLDYPSTDNMKTFAKEVVPSL